MNPNKEDTMPMDAREQMVRAGMRMQSGGDARKEPSIAGAIQIADTILDRLEGLNVELANTLDRIRGPLPPEVADEAEASVDEPGLLPALDRRLTALLAVAGLLNVQAVELGHLMGDLG